MIYPPTALIQLSLADFRERTRRYSFLVTLVAVVYFGYLVGSGIYTPTLSGFRAEDNSAWIAASVAIAGTVVMSFLGFYIVNSSIRRDRLTGVGQILASTSVSRLKYVWSKYLSNVLVLSLIVAILVVAVPVIYVIRGSPGSFSVWALLSPFLLLAFPSVCFIAGTAVLFESCRWLRGGLGNVIYLFLNGFLMAQGTTGDSLLLNMQGFNILESSLIVACPGCSSDTQLYMGPSRGELVPFHWDGMNWTIPLIALRLFWIVLSIVFVTVAAFLFDRFDQSKSRRRKPRSEPTTLPPTSDQQPQHAGRPIALSDLTPPRMKFVFSSMIAAELRLMIKGLPWLWWLVAVGLIVAQLFSPIEVVRQYLLPIAWIWPILAWSRMASREAQYNTGQVVFSAPRPVLRQLPATWIAGVVLALVTSSGFVFRILTAGQVGLLVPLAIGAAFIPALALTLGILSRSSKLFEVCYLLIWYVGPMNRISALDFIGVTAAGASGPTTAMFAAITAVLLVSAFLARSRQLQVG